ncbi:squalene synthase HpnC [Chitinimonas sp. BJYL2]|uniref:squalene synthase HpnC n=1 Tax=Chitinimonas sp. BJYL2 TaxID=2976696 RepID=UPI0022B3F80D|nr:squalene synthase HpnC [Chitinimonas sp. BJYL2]
MPDSYAINHYENFPVASVLLPPAMRRPIAIVYRFARTADDFADEGERTAAERLALLDGYRKGLDEIEAGGPISDALFRDLKTEVIDAHRVPVQLFRDLLDAFAQDVVKTRYADMAELLDYSRRSANPVGRIVLHIAGLATAERLVQSDAICSALQLINFWQDVAIDWQKQRVYLPQDALARHGVTEADIAAARVDARWQALLTEMVQSTHDLLWSGAPLGASLPGRLGMEIRLTVLGGDAILRKTRQADFDVFTRRPKLGKRDWPGLLLGTLSTRRFKA